MAIKGTAWQHPRTPFKARDLSDTLVAVKATPGTLYSLTAINESLSDAYVQIFDGPQSGSATDYAGNVVNAPTLRSTQPTLELFVPQGGQESLPLPVDGHGFNVAITIAATTSEGDGTGAGAGVQVFGNYA